VLTLRFIGFKDLPTFLAGRQQGALPYGNVSRFAAVETESTPHPAAKGQKSTTCTLTANGEEGLYLAIVRTGGAEFSVTVASRIPTQFPLPGVADLTDVIVPYVNSSDRHGLLFLVLGCVWFARHMLNITITDQYAAEINAMGARAPWPEPPEDDVNRLVSGTPLAGVDRIWLTPPGAVEEDDHRPCMDTSALRETPPEKVV
jgi:hypothetical protein